MLRINQSVSAKGALRYFDDALAQAQQYAEVVGKTYQEK